MCGILGLIAEQNVNAEIFDGLTALQHRGQDAAGISTLDENGRLHIEKGAGLVRDVFRSHHMQRLQGTVGIGHVRYPTAGTDSEESSQPFYVNSPYGITLAHNGNLVNTRDLVGELWKNNFRHLNTNSDSEVLLNVLAHELYDHSRKNQLTADDIFKAIEKVQSRCVGAYAVSALISGHGLLGFRDPNGIRPMVYGTRKAANGKLEHLIASETVALDHLGFDLVKHIAPGEAIYIDLKGNVHFNKIEKKTHSHSPCLFEFVYMARPDSIIDEVSVYKARLRMGKSLGQQILKEWADKEIDVVIPIPDTSRTAATEVAHALDLKYREGFIKNRYIGRTFIMPGQEIRKKSVRQKLNTIDLEFKDKNVLLVDDSIVRGTTSKEIVNMAREAGAKKVYFASAAPMVKYPNVYGIDMPAANELIAHNRTVEEVNSLIGSDDLIFLKLESLHEACLEGNPKIDKFEDSVFTGNYVCGNVDQNYLQELYDSRSNR